MPRQESATDVRRWVEEETERIDVVASWESLCDTYETLKLSDPLSDAERLEEYKWIVQQMNIFLSKMRTKLLSCKDLEAMGLALGASLTPTGKVELGSRRALVYQKLRQQWVRTMALQVQAALTQQKEQEEQDGWQY